MKSKLIISLFLVSFILKAQEIPFNRVLSNNELEKHLKKDVKLPSTSTDDLAIYFKEKFSERYFYNYKLFDERWELYDTLYNSKKESHIERGWDHLNKFNDSTTWKLPFNYKNGEPVNAYALRHLARQHKMIDIAFLYFYEGRKTAYLDYFTNQLSSLNFALHQGKYEVIEDGNGVYEAFRAGYRVLNWLQIHSMFLGEEAYSNDEQLTTIATLLQHGAHLYKNNAKFKSGNHQTRGLSALAMISILLRDFKGTDVWYAHSMKLLKEHLDKEINADGFQFERTIHYHISDINNYFYVYQLAKKSNISVDNVWENDLKSLFQTLVKVAYPNKKAPVLSDDTDNPWGEFNDISKALTLGYVLFGNKEFGYFANSNVDYKMFWFLDNKQLAGLKSIQKTTPTYKSLHFDETGYYIMREGWNSSDKMMIISAAVDALKPDHQHGDILGIQAISNENALLPNYQVRYSLKDLELFKNSMVKNVALVNDELLGKKYTSNKGGSGFGKFKQLPTPKVLYWDTSKDLDIFMGSHNGFEVADVAYTRQVFFIDQDFWIVKDNFKAKKANTYKQVWQGHYSLENGANLLRSSFANGTGFDIFQLNKAQKVSSEGARGKGWSIVENEKEGNYSFITVLFPYSSFEKRINEEETQPQIGNWTTSKDSFNSNAEGSISNNKKTYLFNVTQFSIDGKVFKLTKKSDVLIIEDREMSIKNLSPHSIQLLEEELQIGEVLILK